MWSRSGQIGPASPCPEIAQPCERLPAVSPWCLAWLLRTQAPVALPFPHYGPTLGLTFPLIPRPPTHYRWPRPAVALLLCGPTHVIQPQNCALCTQLVPTVSFSWQPLLLMKQSQNNRALPTILYDIKASDFLFKLLLIFFSNFPCKSRCIMLFCKSVGIKITGKDHSGIETVFLTATSHWV